MQYIFKRTVQYTTREVFLGHMLLKELYSQLYPGNSLSGDWRPPVKGSADQQDNNGWGDSGGSYSPALLPMAQEESREPLEFKQTRPNPSLSPAPGPHTHSMCQSPGSSSSPSSAPSFILATVVTDAWSGRSHTTSRKQQ
jgi:hypothetical protein